MKSCQWLSILYLVFFLTSLLMTCSVISVEARKSSAGRSHNKHHKHKQHGNKGKGKSSHPCPRSPSSPSLPLPGAQTTVSNTSFNVLSFGAKGNGATDDSEALLEAWEAACKVAGGVVEIPSGFKFLIKPVTLKGPCMPQLLFKIDGTVVAPPEVSSWPKSGLFQWLNIKWVQNFTIRGSGIIDGQGYEWWSSSPSSKYQKSHSTHIPNMKPTALRFYASNNVTVRDITIVNSPLCHLKFDNSIGIEVLNITITSPEGSPNTDGIHLQNSRDVEIHHSQIGCGDDCVSIQTGCSNVHVHHVNCGPGHGISLGGLGKDRSIACVSDIVVENIVMQNTLYGARIKTWPGGIGSVKNISFSSIQVSNVKVPLVIDQFYCENNLHCKNLTAAVAITNVEFSRIEGTYSYQPVHLACSNDIPCTDVNLVDIQLKPALTNNNVRGLKQVLCWNTYGRTEAPLMPSSIEDYCLREKPAGHGMIQRVHGSHEICHATS